MALTKAELIGSLQNEVRILLHLAGKVDQPSLDYRPSAKQRSTNELLQYLTIMGPELIRAAKAGAFDPAAWTAAADAAKARRLEETIAAIAAERDAYPSLLADVSDADFGREIEMFGSRPAWARSS